MHGCHFFFFFFLLSLSVSWFCPRAFPLSCLACLALRFLHHTLLASRAGVCPSYLLPSPSPSPSINSLDSKQITHTTLPPPHLLLSHLLLSLFLTSSLYGETFMTPSTCKYQTSWRKVIVSPVCSFYKLGSTPALLCRRPRPRQAHVILGTYVLSCSLSVCVHLKTSTR